MKLSKLTPALAAAFMLLPVMAIGQEADVTPPNGEIGYILNTFMLVITGFLVMWMGAGFAMLEAGLVRSKNASMQLTKNIVLFAIASVLYYLVGYKLMYPGDAWTIPGVIGAFGSATLEPVGLADTTTDLSYASVGADFFFQLMFCATTASIVSGTLAERIKLWPFLAFTVVLTSVIYPIGPGRWPHIEPERRGPAMRTDDAQRILKFDLALRDDLDLRGLVVEADQLGHVVVVIGEGKFLAAARHHRLPVQHDLLVGGLRRLADLLQGKLDRFVEAVAGDVVDFQAHDITHKTGNRLRSAVPVRRAGRAGPEYTHADRNRRSPARHARDTGSGSAR